MQMSILDLDDDVLTLILKFVWCGGIPEVDGLDSLSRTCRRLRELAKPIMFRRCRRSIHPTKRIKKHIPVTLSPYIRILDLDCTCHDGRKPPQTVLCRAFRDSAILKNLTFMDRLSTLRIWCYRHPTATGHGLSWRTLSVILSLPQIVACTVYGLTVYPDCADVLDDAQLEPFAMTPLTTFVYEHPGDRKAPRHASEESALDLIVQRLHTSLEKLGLATEPAPLSSIARLDWPRLQELWLTGDRWTDPSTPIISLFSNMPHLRVLALQLFERQDIDVRAIWPRSWAGSSSVAFPWPLLEKLIVSHPDPDDLVWEHLPHTVRHLSLRPWPHRCVRMMHEQREEQFGRWEFPTATSSTLLEAVRRCASRRILSLELEYLADLAELDLLKEVKSRFACLTSLELHRYRRSNSEVIPVNDIAQALAPLPSLLILRLNLDLSSVEMFSPYVFFPVRCSHEDELEEEGENLVQSFIHTLGRSLQEVWLFMYNSLGPKWAVRRVIRDVVGGEMVAGSRFIELRTYQKMYYSMVYDCT